MWHTIGLSVAYPAKPVCQDAHRWLCLAEDTLLITVADGAGTAPLAEVGSEIACRASLDFMVTHAPKETLPKSEKEWRNLIHASLRAALDALQKEAEARQAPLSYLSTTLIVAVATPEGVVVGQVGDGMVFVADGNGEIVGLTAPDRGEYSNETCMLTSASALETVQFAVWQSPVTGIAATTDGLLPITTTLPFYKPYAPFFTNLFAFLRKTADPTEAETKLRGFLLSDRVQNGTGDDLTLVLAVPTDSPLS